MMNPWVFREAKHYLTHGEQPPPATAEQRIGFMRRHVDLAVHSGRYGSELHTLRHMRSRLMNYTKFLAGGKWLRLKFTTVSSLMELDDIIADFFKHRESLMAQEQPEALAV